MKIVNIMRVSRYSHSPYTNFIHAGSTVYFKAYITPTVPRHDWIEFPDDYFALKNSIPIWERT